MSLLEYIDWKLSKCQLASSRIKIYESMHVADGMDEVIVDISDAVYDFLENLQRDINIRQIIQSKNKDSYDIVNKHVESVGWIYSGYNFDPNYRYNLKKNLINGHRPNPCSCVNDVNEPYPIFYGFVFKNTTMVAGVVSRDFSTDSATAMGIYIQINLASCVNNVGWLNEVSLRTTIAHEMQHVFDMYILPDENFVEKRKKNGLTLLLQDNSFQINEEVYKKCDVILTMISEDEIRGRLAELSEILKIIEHNKRLANAIFYDALSYVIPPRVKTTNNHYHERYYDDLVRFVGTSRIIQTITRVNYFRDSLQEIYSLTDDKKRESVILLVGYFLYTDNCLKIFGRNRKLIKDLFGNPKFIETYTNGGLLKDEFVGKFKEQYDIITSVIRDNFCHYAALVNGKLNENMPNFFKYHMVQSLFGGWGNSDDIIVEPL